MKKIISLLLLILCCISLFAFSFVPASLELVHKPYKADTWSFINKGQVIFLDEGKGLNSFLGVARYEEGHDDDYLNFDKVEQPYTQDYVMEKIYFADNWQIDSVFRLKPAFSASVFKTTLKDFTLEVDLHLGMNLVIDMGPGNDVLGFDGLYAYGLGFGYKDIITGHFVMHHYSGHYSDEMLEDMFRTARDSYDRPYSERFALDRTEPGAITCLMEYIRQDSCQFGLAYQPFPFVRIYGEVDFIPKYIKWIRPFVLIPDNQLKKDYDSYMDQVQGQREGINDSEYTERRYSYSDKYRNLMLETGIEFTVPVKRVGTFELSYDVKFLQEGQTYYQLAAYKESNPWSIDHNVVLTYHPLNSKVALEAMYHNGQFPMLNLGWYHCSYFAFGLTVNL